MRHWITSLVVVAAFVSAGCGDDEVKEAAVIAFNLTSMTGSMCPIFDFEFPEGARDTVQGSIEGTPRLEDGDGGNVIDCRVRESMKDVFDVDLVLQTPQIQNFQATGSLSKGPDRPIIVYLASTRTGSLQQVTGCTADVEVIKNGAVWITDLRCPDLADERSPNTHCLGTGGVLFEKCQG